MFKYLLFFKILIFMITIYTVPNYGPVFIVLVFIYLSFYLYIRSYGQFSLAL